MNAKAGIISLLQAAYSGYTPPVLPGANHTAAQLQTLCGHRACDTVLPRGYQLPAVVVHQYGGTQGYELDGPDNMNDGQIQLDAYGVTPASTQQLADALEDYFINFIGPLPDGSQVSACFLERRMDMPFESATDRSGISYRTMLGFRVVAQR